MSRNAYYGTPPQDRVDAEYRYSYSATEGQTTFNALYTVGSVDVYVNGTKLGVSEFTANNGTTVVVGVTLALNDEVQIIARKVTPVVGQVSPTDLVNGLATKADLAGSSAQDFATKNVAVSGDTTIVGTGKRILGDFSNATIASRVAFQTSTLNGITVTYHIPSGTGAQSGSIWSNSSNTTNFNYAAVLHDQATGMLLQAGLSGTGWDGNSIYMPMVFQTGGLERMRISANGNVLFNNSIGAGYGTGSGGAVTQTTSKSTVVTIGKPSGKITTHNASLPANSAVRFQVVNSTVGVNDTVVLSLAGASVTEGISYLLTSWVFNGYFYVILRNLTASPLAEAVDINFTVIKGSVA